MRFLPTKGLIILLTSVNAQNCAQTTTVSVGTCGCSNHHKIGSALQLVASAAQLLVDTAELFTFSPIFIVNGVTQAIATSVGVIDPITCLTWDQASRTVDETSTLLGLLNTYLSSKKSDSGVISTVSSLASTLTSYIQTVSKKLQDHYDCIQRSSVNQVNQQIDQTNQQLNDMNVSPVPYLSANMSDSNQGTYSLPEGWPASTVCYVYPAVAVTTAAYYGYYNQYYSGYGYYPYNNNYQYGYSYGQPQSYPYYPQNYPIYSNSYQYDNNAYVKDNSVEKASKTASPNSSKNKHRHRTTSKKS